ncbi:uncharacterized protein [Dysidea avara]|uniref:uncharacterized protein isoform X2 n=1 Tax=Dysidea avara TaxID=196820 RepID=UPI003334862B
MYKLVILCSVLNLLSVAAQADTVDWIDDSDRSHWHLKVTPDSGCFKERSSASIYCLNITNRITAFAHNVHWIKITNDKFSRGRIWSNDHQLRFPSVAVNDEGSYCCRLSQPLSNSVDLSLHHDRGCTGFTIARISIAAPLQKSYLKNASTMGSCVINSDYHVVTRSLDTATKSWRLKVDPSNRCILLGNAARVNCLNFTAKDVATFAKNIQWFKILDGGGLDPITTSQQGRVRSNGHQLQFLKTDGSDDGQYCCKTLSSGLESGCSPSATAAITIALPPIISTLKHQVTFVGKTITLKCDIANKGRPAASVLLWQRYGKNILKSVKYSVNISDNGTSLTITNTTAEDEGYYNCVVQNSKGQSDNKSMYLFVQPPKPSGCNTVNKFYSLTVGLQTITGDCGLLLQLQKAVVEDVIRKFLVMKCNYSSDLCIDISSDTQCSPNSIVTVNVILKGEQASVLWNETNAVLQKGPVIIESMGISYSLTCVVKTLCPEVEINTTDVPSINPVENDINDTNNDNGIVIVAIGVPLLLVGLFVVILAFVIAIVYQCTKADKAKKCSGTISPCHIEDGNFNNVTTSSNERQSPASSTTLQFDANHHETITMGNSSSSSYDSMHADNNDSSADSGVDSPGYKELFHPQGLNHNECNVYQPNACGDQHIPSQSILPSPKGHPKAEPKSFTLTDPAHSSVSEYNKPEQKSVGDESKEYRNDGTLA